jgi:hypothetical protein
MPIGIDGKATPADDSDADDEDSDKKTQAEANAKPAEDSEIGTHYKEEEKKDLKGWGDEVVRETAARSCNSWSGGKSSYGKGKDKGYKTSKGKGTGKTLEELERKLQELERKLEEAGKKIRKLDQKTDWQGKMILELEQANEWQCEKILKLLKKTDWMYPIIMRHRELIAIQREELEWWRKHGK